MLPRILKGSFIIQRRHFVLVLLSVAMGSAIISTFAAISYDISSRLAKALRSHGANVLIQPKLVTKERLAGSEERYLREEELPKIKTIFWRHNIVGFAPYLYGIVNVRNGDREFKAILTGTWFNKELLQAEEKTFRAGVKPISPWWKVRGKWLKDGDCSSVMIGSDLVERLRLKIGDNVLIESGKKRYPLKLLAVVKTGGYEENQIFVDLNEAQEILNLPGKVSKVLVSAITVPIDAFGKKDSSLMSRREYDKWFCTPYVTSVARQLESVFSNGMAKPIWQIAEAEGKVLSKLELMLTLLSIVTIVAAVIGVTTTTITSVIKRANEIALMKAIGADSFQIALIFLAEATVIGVVGGVLGYLMSLGAISYIGRAVFGMAFLGKSALLPLAIISSITISVIGNLLPIVRATRIEANAVLRGQV